MSLRELPFPLVGKIWSYLASKEFRGMLGGWSSEHQELLWEYTFESRYPRDYQQLFQNKRKSWKYYYQLLDYPLILFEVVYRKLPFGSTRPTPPDVELPSSGIIPARSSFRHQGGYSFFLQQSENLGHLRESDLVTKINSIRMVNGDYYIVTMYYYSGGIIYLDYYLPQSSAVRGGRVYLGDC